MGVFDDYLNNIDLGSGVPDNFITDLRNAYEADLSIPTAKVNTLEAEKATLATQLTDKDAEITKAKALNFDLVMQLPKTEDDDSKPPQGDDVTDIDDLFT